MGSRFSYSCLSPEDQSHVPSFFAVGLLEAEVGQLHALYSRWRHPEAGTVSFEEVMARLRTAVTPFTRKVFEIDSHDADGNVPFHKFVLGLWNFCTLNEHDMVSFLFDMYDSDADAEGEGVVDMAACRGMVADMYGDRAHPGAERCLVQLAESRGNREYIDLDFLQKFSRNCPDFLHPSIVLKTLWVEGTLGQKFWAKKMQDRKDAHKYAYVPKDVLIKRAKRRAMEIITQPAPQDDSTTGHRSHLPPPPPAAAPVATSPKGGGGGGGGGSGVSQTSRVLSSSSSSISEETESILDRIKSVFFKKTAREEPRESSASRKSKKQKPINITRVSSRTLTYGGSATTAALVEPGSARRKQSVATRKIHMYDFYNNQGGVHES